MTAYSKDRFGIIRREAALARDIGDDHLAAAVRKKDLRRLTRGAFVENSDSFTGPAGADELYRLRSIATATSGLVGEIPHPLSHESSAAVHKLPLLKPDRERVHVTNGKRSGGSMRAQRHIHAALLRPDEITEVDGIRVTGLERTAVDIACAGDFAQALTVFDGAKRLGADDELMTKILGTRRRRGVNAARRALPLSDALSESVGESWSRAQMIDAGLPTPRLQHTFQCGRKEYRADFDWEAGADGSQGVIGEFDGLEKYSRLRRPGETVADAVVREKIREDELRALGFVVVRWIWAVLEKHGVATLLRPWLVRGGLIAA
ncbi:hypothetical protein ACPXCG_22485 [Gordonia sp. DT218]|uniref:hypothetical protein n=1 Tax=unclassified Gordonia (in: high G+C Gram-positive bacteria) TaxID=2657482 RepID=UPI003CF18442